MNHLLLLQINWLLAASPADLAHLLQRTVGLQRLQCMSILHSSEAIAPGYLDELYGELRAAPDAHLSLLPQLIGTEHSTGRLVDLTPQQTLFLVFARHTWDPVLKLHTDLARGRRYCKTLFLLQRVKSRAALLSFFQYLWLQGFRSALVQIGGEQLYRMDPYPSLQLVQLNRTPDAPLIFPRPGRRNLQGYKLRLPVQLDVPSTFWYCNKQTGELQLDGIGGTMMSEFMRHINVRLELQPLYVNESNNLNMPALLQLLEEQRAELSPHKFTTLGRSVYVDYSYPFRIVQRCFMVPLHDSVPRGLYIFLPFQTPVWLSAALLFLVIFLVRWLAHRRLQLFSRFSSLLGIPGSQSAAQASYFHRLPWPRYLSKLFACLCIVFGVFIFVQMYATKLMALFSVTIRHKPSLTLDELLALPYPILVSPGEVAGIISSFGHEAAFHRRFAYAPPGEFYGQRTQMQAGYVYPISTIRWNFVSQQQRYLHHKRFWLSKLCYGTFPYQFQLAIDSHFKEPLHRFELHAHEAGLPSYWQRGWYTRALSFGFVHDFESAENFELRHQLCPLSLHLLAPVLYFYLFGLTLSLGAFLLETVSRFNIRAHLVSRY
ncbi:uncharacterized protein LOC108599843 [Drosophila busckii]|uniref:uncharacterized protein LOC108599843 n=1 Tax=Drosophila busckii TaxID=30019 RepID=UPI00083F0F81|nr:uncharacterized protein LOC108599843 [Drosophila busckii]